MVWAVCSISPDRSAGFPGGDDQPKSPDSGNATCGRINMAVVSQERHWCRHEGPPPKSTVQDSRRAVPFEGDNRSLRVNHSESLWN